MRKDDRPTSCTPWKAAEAGKAGTRSQEPAHTARSRHKTDRGRHYESRSDGHFGCDGYDGYDGYDGFPGVVHEDSFVAGSPAAGSAARGWLPWRLGTAE